MKKILILIVTMAFSSTAFADTPKNPKTKFYDFGEMLIDGEIKKPTALYTDVRQRAQFDRLLRLKKSFMPELFDSARERVFR